MEPSLGKKIQRDIHKNNVSFIPTSYFYFVKITHIFVVLIIAAIGSVMLAIDVRILDDAWKSTNALSPAIIVSISDYIFITMILLIVLMVIYLANLLKKIGTLYKYSTKYTIPGIIVVFLLVALIVYKYNTIIEINNYLHSI